MAGLLYRIKLRTREPYGPWAILKGVILPAPPPGRPDRLKYIFALPTHLPITPVLKICCRNTGLHMSVTPHVRCIGDRRALHQHILSFSSAKVTARRGLLLLTASVPLRVENFIYGASL